MSTYSQFQQQVASEKVGLVVLEAAERVTGWALYSGSIYRAPITEKFLTRVTLDGSALAEVESIVLTTAGKWYHDPDEGYLYIVATDSGDPSDNYVVVTHKMFFSNKGVALPYDLSSGRDVYWDPLLKDAGSFSVEIDDSKTNIGVAISGKATLRFFNDRTYWGPIYDKKVFENKRVRVYSWSPSMPATEAKLLYVGFVTNRQFSLSEITFQLNDLMDGLRALVSLPNMESVVGARIPESLNIAKQRRVYGYVNGHVPTPIDQILGGYPLTGTMSISNGSSTVTGSSTTFLAELSPGDGIIIGGSEEYSVESVDSDTQVTLSETFSDDSEVAATALVVPTHAKRYANRTFLLAGHALARPSTTVLSVVDNATFFVADTSQLHEGDQIEIGSNAATIRILGTTIIKLEQAISGSVSPGDTVYRSTVMDVRINNTSIEYGRDYSYDKDTAILTLDPLCEFNVALPRGLSGTITTSSGTRDVTGSGTLFLSELSVGDWIRDAGEDDWFEILSITDDTNLVLRANATYSSSGVSGERKKPHVYDSSVDTLSCSINGKAAEDGSVLAFAGGIVKDLLIEAGYEDVLEESSFDTADEVLPYRLGIVIPETFNGTGSTQIRNVISDVCRSVFASVIQNESFNLEMVSLDPSALSVTSATTLDKTDALSVSVKSDSSFILRAATVRYGKKEYDHVSGNAAEFSKTENNERGRYASESTKTMDVKTYLLEEDDAQVLAARWAYLFDSANSRIDISTKMKFIDANVMDVVKVDLPYLYTRLGSESSTSRLTAVVSTKKSLVGVELTLTDFGNSFTRVARIADTGSLEYSSASESEKLVNGYIPGADGFISDESSTGWLNLIW